MCFLKECSAEDDQAKIFAVEKEEEGLSRGKQECSAFNSEERGVLKEVGGGRRVTCMGELVCCRVNGALIVPATFQSGFPKVLTSPLPPPPPLLCLSHAHTHTL